MLQGVDEPVDMSCNQNEPHISDVRPSTAETDIVALELETFVENSSHRQPRNLRHHQHYSSLIHSSTDTHIHGAMAKVPYRCGIAGKCAELTPNPTWPRLIRRMFFCCVGLSTCAYNSLSFA